MKRINLFFYILFYPLFVQAQNFDIDWGQIYSHKESSRTISISDDHYYVLNQQNKINEIAQFDFNHNLVKEFPLNFEYEETHGHYWDIVHLVTGSYHILAEEDRKNDKVHLFTTELSNEGHLNSNPSKLISFNYKRKTFVLGEDGPNKDKIGIGTSKDSTKVVITSVKHVNDYGKGKDNEIYSVAVFDASMNLIWEKDVEFPFADKKIIIEQFEVNNHGEVYLLSKIKLKQPNELFSNDYTFSLFKISPDKDPLEIVIIPKQAHPLGAIMQITEDDEVSVFGFYDGEKRQNLIKLDGLFTMRFNRRGKELFQNTSSFENSFLDDVKRKYSKFTLHIDKLFYDQDKEQYLLIAEDRFEEIKIHKNQDGSRDQEIHFFTNNLVVVSISKEGTLNWALPIDKDFTGQEKNKSSLSYLVTYKDGNLFFLFNDEKTLTERMSYDRKGKLLAVFTELVKIDEQGKITQREILFLSNEQIGPLDTTNSKTNNDGNILIFNANYKKYKCGILNLN